MAGTPAVMTKNKLELTGLGLLEIKMHAALENHQSHACQKWYHSGEKTSSACSYPGHVVLLRF